MNSVERVKALCKERKIPISRLESDCGFSNGYIGQLRKGTFPVERLYKIADYLNVAPEYLLNGTVKEADDSVAFRQELLDRPEGKILFDAAKDAPTSALLEAAALILRYKEESKYK